MGIFMEVGKVCLQEFSSCSEGLIPGMDGSYSLIKSFQGKIDQSPDII